MMNYIRERLNSLILQSMSVLVGTDEQSSEAFLETMRQREIIVEMFMTATNETVTNDDEK